MIETILIMVAIILILGTALFFSIKSNIKKSKENNRLQIEIDNLKQSINTAIVTENQKTEIRNKHNEKQTEILNSDKPVIDNDIMPVIKTTKKGKFSRTGGKSTTIKY